MFGVSLFSWAIAGLTIPDDAGSVVRWSIAIFHITAGLLIVFRAPQSIAGDWRHLAGCIPSQVSAGFVFVFASPTDQWDVAPQIAFAVATFWTIVSFFFLGRSFAVFPSVRKIVVRGPYRYVRHPAYLGELAMLACCVWVATKSNLWVWIAFCFAISTIAVRILIEESLLAKTENYRDYREAVSWRLIPFVW